MKKRRVDAKLISLKKRRGGEKGGTLAKRPFPARPKKLPRYRNIELKF